MEKTPSSPLIQFYLDKIPAQPDNKTWSELIQFYKGNYKALEHGHGYIQWLFPNYRKGVNPYCPVLTKESLLIMKSLKTIQNRLIISLDMMIDFFGIKRKKNQFFRADNYLSRFQNIDSHFHNNLRISRILLCLLEFGHKKMAMNLVSFFYQQIMNEKCLQKSKTSLLKFWLGCFEKTDLISMKTCNFIQSSDELSEEVKT